MRRSVIVTAILILLAVLLVAGPLLVLSPTTSEVAPKTDVDPDEEMYYPTNGESGFWPYLNSRQVFEKRSPINVIVIGDTEEVIQALMEAGNRDWEEPNEEQEEAEPGSLAGIDGNQTRANASGQEGIVLESTAIQWGRTTGASRYAYIDPGPGEGGRWVDETAQVHDGTYYGHRYHLRMYESPHLAEPWIAIQAHSEYFDWFTLRHRVTGSNQAQQRLERDLMSLPRVDIDKDVRRVHLGNANASDADGWATFVDLIGLTTVGLLAGRSVISRTRDRLGDVIDANLADADRQRLKAIRDRVEVGHGLLFGVIPALVLGVRGGGIALEATGLFSMHTIAALLYPVIALGLPIGTYGIARSLKSRRDAALVAGSALAIAFWLDYAYLGVVSISIDVILQRVLVVVALGLIAGGATHRAARDHHWNDMLAAGVVLWALVLGSTLFGYL